MTQTRDTLDQGEPARPIHFPPDSEIGTLEIRSESRERRRVPARGTILLQYDESAVLNVDDRGPIDLSDLSEIGGAALFGISLHGAMIRNDDLRHLAHLTGLFELQIYSDAITGDGLAFLAGLTQLRTLELSQIEVDDDGVAFLAGMTCLSRLDLSATRITDRALEIIGRLPALEWLNLAGTSVSDASLHELTGLEKLRRLDLDHTRVRGPGLGFLEKLPALEVLRLPDTEVDDDIVPVLQRFGRLNWIDLQSTLVSEHGAKRLRQSFPSARLHHSTGRRRRREEIPTPPPVSWRKLRVPEASVEPFVTFLALGMVRAMRQRMAPSITTFSLGDPDFWKPLRGLLPRELIGVLRDMWEMRTLMNTLPDVADEELDRMEEVLRLALEQNRRNSFTAVWDGYPSRHERALLRSDLRNED